jgi:hypothetical protein
MRSASRMSGRASRWGPAAAPAPSPTATVLTGSAGASAAPPSGPARAAGSRRRTPVTWSFGAALERVERPVCRSGAWVTQAEWTKYPHPDAKVVGTNTSATTGGAPFFLHRDHQATTRLVTRGNGPAAGTVEERSTYAAWGARARHPAACATTHNAREPRLYRRDRRPRDRHRRRHRRLRPRSRPAHPARPLLRPRHRPLHLPRHLGPHPPRRRHQSV